MEENSESKIVNAIDISKKQATPLTEIDSSKQAFPGPKEDLIATAVTFLQNPAVAVRPRQEKKTFLAKKGLSDQEISTAFMRVENSTPMTNIEHMSPGMYDGFVVPAIPPRSLSSPWSTVKSTANVFLLLSGAAFGCHYFYQWILKTYFSGQKIDDQLKALTKFQKNMQTIMEKLQKSLDDLRVETTNQNKFLQELLESKSVNGEQVELMTELASIKSLLLNKRAFPAAPTTGIALPEWQRIKTKTESTSSSDTVVNGVQNNLKTPEELCMTESLYITDSDLSSQLNGSEISDGDDKLDLSMKMSTDDSTNTIN